MSRGLLGYSEVTAASTSSWVITHSSLSHTGGLKEFRADIVAVARHQHLPPPGAPARARDPSHPSARSPDASPPHLSCVTFYATQTERSLKPDDYLVPSRRVIPYMAGLTPGANVELVRTSTSFDPEKPIATPERCVHRALIAFGHPVRDDMDRSIGEGVHTLRRSGARALFDQLVQGDYDGAMRTVQSMLHHASVTTTEIYLGIHLDKKRRDELVRGNAMFPIDRSNVIGMEERRSEAESCRDIV